MLNMSRLLACILALCAGAVFFVYLHLQRTFRARRWIRKQRAMGLPMPKHDAVWGHLPVVNDAINDLPANCAVDVALANIAQDFPNGAFYLDFAPFDKPNVIVTSPEVASQVQSLTQLEKPPYVAGVLNTVCGGPNLTTMTGHMGKLWRGTFERGFSVAYMQTLIPMIAREVEVFAKIIERKSNRGEVVTLLEPATRLAIDVITRVGLDARLGCQEKDSALSSVMLSQLWWGGFSASMSLWKLLNPIRPFMLWYNKRQMHKVIGAEIDDRYAELANDKGNVSLQSKSAISLALKELAGSTRPNEDVAKKVDSAQKTSMVSQIMLFLVAGQDTTGSALTYCFREMYAHRPILERIRAEHAEIFGDDMSASQIANALDECPERLNQLAYTTAVIKESLRLHPPGSIVRKGERGITLTDCDGNIFPTEGCNIWVLHTAMQRDPRYFVNPDSFIPERWLVDEGHPLCPVKGAWKPFWSGRRDCLGQNLAMLAMKIALLMIARNFDVTEAYDAIEEADSTKQQAEVKVSGAERMNYGNAYPVYGTGLAVLPNGEFPCRIKPVSSTDCS